MLRIHFTTEDLPRIRIARTPDPLWETAFSLHRLQSTRGRWAFAEWHRTARLKLIGTPLGTAVRKVLFQVVPRARYFPDFLTPPEAEDGLDAGCTAILDTPPDRVRREVETLARVVGAPAWAARLTERRSREELVSTLRAYHSAVIAPHHDRVRARIDGERAVLGRSVLDDGLDGLLAGLKPGMHWRPPVLEVDYAEDRDMHLDGRGLRLVPSYFCWHRAVAFADPALEPTLLYPLHRDGAPEPEPPGAASLGALLGRTRAAALRAARLGATTSELARALGVSPATATHHTSVLREAGLISSRRYANTVLHTVTPTGAALLRPRPPRRVPPAAL
ncbi:helix-turn-helix domain-containing protein [Streptomyces sp. NPDC002561]|uniref:helix-turn-helix domain-containing protein n=1 Tax=Streptomyces sp. NPDC002561 TaxID=3154418 RepID=UPI00332A99B3